MATNNIGWLYQKGQGVTVDNAEALKWYRKAAAAGNSEAQNSIGWFYENGMSVAADRAEALAWYRKAAAAGDNTAKGNLDRLEQAATAQAAATPAPAAPEAACATGDAQCQAILDAVAKLVKKNPKVQVAEVAKVTDQATLAAIARSSAAYEASHAAVVRVTDEAVLAGIARSPNVRGGVAVAAVERISNEKLLAVIVLASSDYELRNKALNRIKDPSLLLGIARRNASLASSAIELIADQAVLDSLARTGDNKDLRGEAVKKVTNQDTLEYVANNDPNEWVRVDAVRNMTSQRALAQLARTGSEAVRKAAFGKVTDPAVAAQVAQDDPSLDLREDAIKKVTDVRVLGQIAVKDPSPDLRRWAILQIKDARVLGWIAKNETDLLPLRAALFNLKDRPSLVDVAHAAKYKQTRAILTARLNHSWRRDLELSPSHCTAQGANYTTCQVTVKNKSDSLAYSGFTFRPINTSIADVEAAPGMGGSVEPGGTTTLNASLGGDWRSLVLHYPDAIEVLYAEPMLPKGASDLRVGGEAGPYVRGPNNPPLVSEHETIRTTTTSNVLAEIKAVTTEITVDAWDPDLDPLTFSWTATSGTIEGTGPVGTWHREFHGSRLVPGTATVTVTDGRGGKTTVSYEMK